ncbi:hypothetical protein R4Z09_12010 [Niallia oryzisoli]|uniref:Uncharacterized protein n=1 Tax=Niallia oryzisoli TaxID=1737571 RepID=A0ABZ2CIT4_9BACI
MDNFLLIVFLLSGVSAIGFLLASLVSLIKKNGKAKKQFKITGGLFGAALLSVIIASSISPEVPTTASEETHTEEVKEEKKEEPKEAEKEKPVATVEEAKAKLSIGMTMKDYQDYIDSIKIDLAELYTDGYDGALQQISDGYFFVKTDGVNVVDLQFFTTKEEGSTYVSTKTQEAKAAETAAKRSTAKTIDFPHLEKNPDRYAGEYVTYTGEIVQILEGNGTTNIRLSVTKESYGYSYNDLVFVEYAGYTDFVEGDIVTIYGTVYGSYSYESQAGYNISLPGIIADSVE